MPVIFQCAQCAASVSRPKSQMREGKNFCSRKCADLGKDKSRNKNQVEFNCDWCGAPSSQVASRYKMTQKHFCSPDCSRQWKSVTNSGSGNPSFKDSIQVCKCLQCGADVKKNKFRRDSAKYDFCSHQCYGEWRTGKFTGEDSGSWKGGQEYYRGPNWKKQSLLCRQRDNFTCQLCGGKGKVHGGVIAHHIQPFSSFKYERGGNDNYIAANKLNNLISLCPSCHGKVERGGVDLGKELWNLIRHRL